MPFFIAAFMGGLATVMASLVGRVLLALGMSYVVYKGVNVGTDTLVQYIKTSYGSFSGEVGGLLTWLYVDKAISMIISATTTALAIKTTGGAVKKLVLK
ncbi:DUF2523 family protein [Undibacterium sp. Rencai35W]|uniref:DUF2523 family protein n=1 Tax=Undibacterium sp. Rencai35W TaxID=3413046 RepID=UPI003BF34DA2